MKILMTVHHGETKTEIVNGESFQDCLTRLSFTPLYRGYGPALSDMEGLRLYGKMSYGWADYNFYNDEQIAELIK